MHSVKYVRLFFAVEIIVCFILYFLYSLFTYSSVILAGLVVIALFDVFLIFYVQNKRRIKIKYRIICTLFLLGYVIVFYQCYIDLLLGFMSADNSLFVSSSIIIKCCLLSTIGLSAFGFGYLKEKKKIGETTIEKKDEVVDLGLFRVMLFVATIVYLYYNMGKMMSGVYSQEILEAEAGTMVLYSDIFFMISFVLLMTYIVKNNIQFKGVSFPQYFRQFGLGSLFCLLLYIVIHSVIGDRGPVIVCLAIFFGAYFLIGKSFGNKLTLTIGIVVAILFFSVIGQVRNKERAERFNNMGVVLKEMYKSDVSIIPFTKELSSSVLTLHYSVYYVPEKHSFLYGVFPIRYVISSVPFGDRLFFSIYPLPKRYTSSSFFITWLIQGDFYAYGNGSSCIADLYLSFGVVGVLLGMLLWGLFVRYLENKVRYGELSINLIIIYLFTCGYAITVNREYLLVYMNYCVFAIILNYIYRLLTNK